MSTPVLTLQELMEALELYNDNTDGNGPNAGETVYVFYWPEKTRGGEYQKGEWALMSDINPKKHQKEYGGFYVPVTIPGHNKPFNVFKTSVDVMRQLGLRITNPTKHSVRRLPTGTERREGHYFVRKIGDAIIKIKPTDNGDWVYEGSVAVNGDIWEFDALGAPRIEHGRRSEDDPDLIDEMAASAVSFGAYYTSHNRGDAPDWAPDEETADAIEAGTAWAMDDRGGYEIIRVNPDAPVVATPPAAAPAATATVKNPQSTIPPRLGSGVDVIKNKDGRWIILVNKHPLEHEDGSVPSWKTKTDALLAYVNNFSKRKNPQYGPSGACNDCGSTPCECVVGRGYAAPRYVVEHMTSKDHSSIRKPFFGIIDTHEGITSWRKFSQFTTRKAAQQRADDLNRQQPYPSPLNRRHA